MIPGGWSFSRVIARVRLSSWRFAGTRNVCAPREKKQGSPAKAPGVDGVNGGVLQSSDAMTEAIASTGLCFGGGVGGKKRMWLPAVRAGGFFVRSAASGAKSLQVLCSAVQCSGGLARRMDAFEARSRGWVSDLWLA